MILQSLYDYAQKKQMISAQNRAFKKRSVHWIIDLDDEGQYLGLIAPEQNQIACPHSIQPKSAGGVADFLVDGTIAVLGIDLDNKSRSETQQAKREVNNRKKFDDFWSQITQAYEVTQSPLLASCLQFKPIFAQPPEFLRWGHKEISDAAETHSSSGKAGWWLKLDDGSEKKLKGTESFTFAVNQKLVVEDTQHIHTYWLEEFKKEIDQEQSEAPRGLCSITGQQNQPIALTHTPKIKRVPNTQTFGANIVSFDKQAFTSYQLEQSEGAKASVDAAAGYCRALNSMLQHDSHHSLSLGSAVCCFWTKDPHNRFSHFLKEIFKSADPAAVQDFLKSLHKGHQTTVEDDRFYAVTLAGNAGRIMIRNWIDISLKQAQKNFQLWFDDLHLVSDSLHNRKFSPLSLDALARTTVRDPKDIRTEVVNQLFLAALEGRAPALSLLQPLLARLRVIMAENGTSALRGDHSRFALMRLIINRNQRMISTHKESSMEIPPQCDDTQKDPGYLCGRLLAVLSRAQEKAHNYKILSAGVSERYFGTAMASPQSVFPLLLKLNRHHLNKLDKSSTADFIEQDIQSIVQHLNDFPRTLDLKGQGRFALGYYHEQKAEKIKIQEYKTKSMTENEDHESDTFS